MPLPTSARHVALIAGIALAAVTPGPATAGTGYQVDVELVIAADVSGSMGMTLSSHQRAGFVAAFRDPSLRDALLSGPWGRVAITYVEWAGADRQTVVVPWRLIDDAADAAALADELAAAEPAGSGGDTSISAALFFARDLMADNDFDALKSVIDVSGNGENNAGPPMAAAAQAMSAARITVNGLVYSGDDGPDRDPYGAGPDRYDTAAYYRSQVRRGTGSFVMMVEDGEAFAEAVLRKLVLEIALR